MGKNKAGLCLLLAMICLLTLAPEASAAERGSIKVIEMENAVGLYPVARADGSLTDAFIQAPIDDISDSLQAVENARKLWSYAREQRIPAQEKQPDGLGNVQFKDLEEGLYLIGSLAEEAEFDPFLVRMPTVINGEKIYHVTADPKQEEPTEPQVTTEPTEPTESTEPSEPTQPTKPTEPGPGIPQTGDSVIPKYLLLAIGTLAIAAGLLELIRGRKEESYE